MHRAFRALAVGLLALVAFATVTSAASALTVNPTTLSGTAGSTTLTINRSGGGTLSAICASSSVSGNITSSASGVLTAGGSITAASFLNCNLAGTLLTVSVSNLPWRATVTGLISGGAVTGASLAISGILVRFRTAAGCDFNVTGTRTSDLVVLTGGVVRNIPFTNTTLSLAVSSILAGAAACSLAGVAVGNTARFNTDAVGYTLSPSVTLTP